MNHTAPKSGTSPSTVEASRAEGVHSERFVKGLFDEMAQTYGIVNMLSSLGFAWYWRREAVRALPATATAVADLMAGGGECLGHLRRHLGARAAVDLVDWSRGMCDRAETVVARGRFGASRVLCASALEIPVPNHHYDAVVSTFGMKTLTADETRAFARELRRVLKPGGHFSILEFSKPRAPLVGTFFRLYVKHYVPLLGRLFLGNPDNYRMLWRYTEEFGDCSALLGILRDEGFSAAMSSHFLGSATQVVGRAPVEAS